MEDKKMESKIANYTREIKSKKWAEIVMNCNTSGISKTAWCRENNVSLKSFFYWQHKLRLSHKDLGFYLEYYHHYNQ
jgi:hypothetical protein